MERRAVGKKPKPKKVTIYFNELTRNDYKKTDLKRLLHNMLWDMRGKYGYDNVKLVHTTVTLEEVEKGHPKEALSWDYYRETVSVVGFSQKGVVQEVVDVFIHDSESFDAVPFTDSVATIEKFEGFELIVTPFMQQYLKEVLLDRLNYFRGYGLKYVYKNIDKREEDTFTYDY